MLFLCSLKIQSLGCQGPFDLSDQQVEDVFIQRHILVSLYIGNLLIVFHDVLIDRI